jgi:cytochrome c peroxidase
MTTVRLICWVSVGLILTAGCSATPSTSAPAAAPGPVGVTPAVAAVSIELNPRLMRRFKPLRPVLSEGEVASKAMVDLGRMLYFETRLSQSNAVSCNTCHPLASYGATSDATSTGVHGKKGSRNAPTTYNAAGHFAQFWDGRSPTVEEQAKDPIVNPVEMGMPGPKVVAVLEAIPGYVTAFKAAFPGGARPVTFDHVGQALGAFERGLVTPSRWDRYLLGDKAALTDLEKEGGRLFTNLDCLVCHTGELVGGSTFEKLGRMKAWPNQTDRGRQGVTRQDVDGMSFKVPSLRNVAMTAPYFHDGSARTLDEAVRLMATHQLDEELSEPEVTALVAFLGSLTGDLPLEYIAPPTLPADGKGSAVAGIR